MTLNTIPELKKKELVNITGLNETKLPADIVFRDNTAYILTDNPIFETLELICVTWFTLEYIIRFLSSPNKKKFIFGALNIIDLLTILPFYMFLFLQFQNNSIAQYFNNSHHLILAFRMLRIIRIFKLARYSTGLQSLGHTLKENYKELGLMFMFISIGVFLFSSLAYYAEKSQLDTKFTSVPATFW